MKPLRSFFPALIAIGLIALPARADLSSADEKVASDLWASAFAWLQTGKNLAVLEQWPLALASYTESMKQFTVVVTQFPEYEPEILAYRMENLKGMINETEQKLDASDHEVSMLYLDTIEMMEKAEYLRFTLENFGESYKSMIEAQTLMQELIGKRPEAFETAMKSQVERIESNIAWLSIQLGYEKRPKHASLASVLGSGHGMPRMLGTTEFIGESDLPADPNEHTISSSLFPQERISTGAVPIMTAPVETTLPESPPSTSTDGIKAEPAPDKIPIPAETTPPPAAQE